MKREDLTTSSSQRLPGMQLWFIIHFKEGEHTQQGIMGWFSRRMLKRTYYRIWTLDGCCGKSKEWVSTLD